VQLETLRTDVSLRLEVAAFDQAEAREQDDVAEDPDPDLIGDASEQRGGHRNANWDVDARGGVDVRHSDADEWFLVEDDQRRGSSSHCEKEVGG
jgi:hypothetical protein